jgi:hypothetical protein
VWPFLLAISVEVDVVIIVLQADVYTDSSGACAAFIANIDDKNDKTVEFRNTSYHLPAWSVSILPDCRNVVYNTAKVGYLCIYSCFPSDIFTKQCNCIMYKDSQRHTSGARVRFTALLTISVFFNIT